MVESKSAEHHAPRRQWSLAEKRRIVELTFGVGSSTRAIALEHGVHPTSLSHWKTLYRAGKLDVQPLKRVRRATETVTFLPVKIAPTARTSHRPKPHHEAHTRGSVVQLMLESGATLRFEIGVDAALVCALVAELRR
ncbi:MAG: hypothetical protein NVS1B14_07780 [Vulcanimicrobiaceae bacterium]